MILVLMASLFRNRFFLMNLVSGVLLFVFVLASASNASASDSKNRACFFSLQTFYVEKIHERLEYPAPAAQSIARDLSKTLFIVPDNDGEAHRILQILKSAGAPHIRRSSQNWGARLDKEKLIGSELKDINQVVIVEIPGPKQEEELRKKGIDVVIIDHHSYEAFDKENPNLDRWKSRSSLEQLTDWLGWKRDEVDEALAVNDRSFIPGLRKLGLSKEEISQIRLYDLVSQGNIPGNIRVQVAYARQILREIPKYFGVYFIEGTKANQAVIRQEIILHDESPFVNVLMIAPDKIGFSGDPKIVEALSKFNYADFGFSPNSYVMYSGGEGDSKFFGFKPKYPPPGSLVRIPRSLVVALKELFQEMESRK